MYVWLFRFEIYHFMLYALWDFMLWMCAFSMCLYLYVLWAADTETHALTSIFMHRLEEKDHKPSGTLRFYCQMSVPKEVYLGYSVTTGVFHFCVRGGGIEWAGCGIPSGLFVIVRIVPGVCTAEHSVMWSNRACVHDFTGLSKYYVLEMSWKCLNSWQFQF